MKGIKEWVEDLASNKELAKKFEGLEDSKEVVNLAKKEGYEFTEDEFMDLRMEAVSGGKISLDGLWGSLKDIFYDMKGRFEGKGKLQRKGEEKLRHLKDWF